jgi:hypothetical protein
MRYADRHSVGPHFTELAETNPQAAIRACEAAEALSNAWASYKRPNGIGYAALKKAEQRYEQSASQEIRNELAKVLHPGPYLGGGNDWPVA